MRAVAVWYISEFARKINGVLSSKDLKRVIGAHLCRGEYVIRAGGRYESAVLA